MGSQKKQESWESELKKFTESVLAERAGQGLSGDAAILIHIDDKIFLYRKAGGRNHIQESAPMPADVLLWLSSGTLQHLLKTAALPETGIPAMGVAAFERIFHPEEAERIRFRLEASVFTLWRKGYFSVLKAGGPEVASYLARLGQGGFSRLKDALRKF